MKLEQRNKIINYLINNLLNSLFGFGVHQNPKDRYAWIKIEASRIYEKLNDKEREDILKKYKNNITPPL